MHFFVKIFVDLLPIFQVAKRAGLFRRVSKIRSSSNFFALPTISFVGTALFLASCSGTSTSPAQHFGDAPERDTVAKLAIANSSSTESEMLRNTMPTFKKGC